MLLVSLLDSGPYLLTGYEYERSVCTISFGEQDVIIEVGTICSGTVSAINRIGGGVFVSEEVLRLGGGLVLDGGETTCGSTLGFSAAAGFVIMLTATGSLEASSAGLEIILIGTGSSTCSATGLAMMLTGGGAGGSGGVGKG